MRVALLSFLFVAACAPTAPTSTPTDWALLADALSSEEYAETFLDELASRLEDAGADLEDGQRDGITKALYDGAEAQRAIIVRYRDASPDETAEAGRALQAADERMDAAVEAFLRPAQVPVYRALQAEVRAALAREAAGG